MACRLIFLLLLAGTLPAADDLALSGGPRGAAAEWKDLAEELATQPETEAAFEERRYFSYRTEPVVLRGEVRVSRERGLSLHYRKPDERTVIIDERGMIWRDEHGKDSAPPDPRANAANAMLLKVLRLDFAALEKDFELTGTRDGARWSIELEPRTAAVRRSIGSIAVAGSGTEVRWIELRRSLKQRIEIALSDVRAATFGADERQRYFR
jgi:hypothetical protein